MALVNGGRPDPRRHLDAAQLMAELDDIMRQPLRLKIMAALNALPKEVGLEFARLKKLTGATDGNLGAHIETLAKAGYVSVEKAFVSKKPQTTAIATAAAAGRLGGMWRRCRRALRGSRFNRRGRRELWLSSDGQRDVETCAGIALPRKFAGTARSWRYASRLLAHFHLRVRKLCFYPKSIQLGSLLVLTEIAHTFFVDRSRFGCKYTCLEILTASRASSARVKLPHSGLTPGDFGCQTSAQKKPLPY